MKEASVHGNNEKSLWYNTNTVPGTRTRTPFYLQFPSVGQPDPSIRFHSMPSDSCPCRDHGLWPGEPENRWRLFSIFDIVLVIRGCSFCLIKGSRARRIGISIWNYDSIIIMATRV
uniref:HDC19167 n=1 Tax=Drosophila melanogaster TaxID=7227 RepID=Q6IIB0_DROME|nr:TPA_inf: HDC19167 [Drosophila melanogaster]